MAENVVKEIKQVSNDNNWKNFTYEKESFVSNIDKTQTNNIEKIIEGENLNNIEVLNRPIIQVVDNTLINNLFLKETIDNFYRINFNYIVKGVYRGFEKVSVTNNSIILTRGIAVYDKKYIDYVNKIYKGKIEEINTNIEITNTNQANTTYFIELDENGNFIFETTQDEENKISIGKIDTDGNGNFIESTYEDIREFLKLSIDSFNQSNSFIQNFSVFDFQTNSGIDYYYISFQHDLNTLNIITNVWEKNGDEYKTIPESVVKTDENTIEIRVSKNPDERFEGRVNVIALDGFITSDFDSRITTNENDISNLQTRVSTNENDIDDLQDEVDEAIEEAKNNKVYDIVIKTQAEFEYWFGTGEEYKTCEQTTQTQGGWTIENQGSQINREIIDIGDGLTTTFSDTLNNQYIKKTSTSISYIIGGNNYSATDDGQGSIFGTHITSGNIDYVTGQINLAFDEPIDNSAEIKIDYYFLEYSIVYVPKSINIFIKSNPEDGTTENFQYSKTGVLAYTFNTEIRMLGNLVLEGNDVDLTILTKGNNYAQFFTDYEIMKDNCSTTGDSWIVVSDVNGLKEKQHLFFSGDNNFYQIKAIDSANNKIQVNENIGTAYSGQNIYILVENIKLINLTIDGRGGVNGLGGSLNTKPVTLNYSYSVEIDKVVNGRDNNDGGCVYNAYSSHNTITAIDCEAILEYSYISGGGGGVYNHRSQYNIITTINCNTSNDGGGVYNYYSPYNTITTTNCYSNGLNGGGGVYNYYSSNNTITATNCSANNFNRGGGVYNNYSNNNTITATNCVGRYAGGVYNYYSSNNTITAVDCYAEDFSGGVYNHNSSYNTITTTDCGAGYLCGGVYNNYSNNNTITATNCSANYYSGGVYNNYSNNNTITATNCSANYYGGGVYNRNTSNNQLLIGNWYGNSASDGTNVYNDSGSWTFNGVVDNNIRIDTTWQTGNL